MQVISLTKGKIRQVRISNQKIVIKKSSFEEIKKIEEARKLLKKSTILLDGKNFVFHVPKIYDYKNNEIYMELLTGNNLEIALRTPKHRNAAVKVTNLLFQYIYDNSLYWGDFAPRNIMIDSDRQIINLCDFEKGIQTNITGKEYLQNYTYEEYAAFLFPKERTFSERLNDIFTVDKKYNISMCNIQSHRVRSIIQEKKIPVFTLTNQTVADINKMIIIAETPYKKQNQNIFPIIDLEKIKDVSYQSFAKEICKRLKIRGHAYGCYGRI